METRRADQRLTRAGVTRNVMQHLGQGMTKLGGAQDLRHQTFPPHYRQWRAAFSTGDWKPYTCDLWSPRIWTTSCKSVIQSHTVQHRRKQCQTPGDHFRWGGSDNTTWFLLHVFGLQPIRAVFIARISMGWIEHFAWGSVLRSEFVPRCSEALQKKCRGSNSNPDHAVMFERNAFQFRFYLVRLQVDRLQPEIDRYR